MEVLDKNILIHAGTLLQSENFKPEKNVLIEIKDGIIKNISPAGKQVPRHARDLSKYILIPGLVDSHLHVALDGVDFKSCIARWEYPDEMEKQFNKILSNLLSYGITAFRDGGDIKSFALELRNRNLTGPIIKAPGYAVRIKDMYGSFLGPGIEKKQIPETLSHLASLGIDHVKILASGLVNFKHYGKVGPVQFSEESLKQITREAKQRGLKVMAHVNSKYAVEICARAGINSVEHGYFIDKETLKLMSENGVHWVPTLSPFINRLKSHHFYNLSEQEKYNIDKAANQQIESVGLAKEMGVPLAVGTDAGAPGVMHGQSFHDELEYFSQAGLSSTDILKCASIEGSKLLNLNPGLEVGKPARFTVVERNPLDDLNTLRNPKCVMI
ncbi:MAG: amidohydrolase family protein [Clostridiales bacterium]|nr:amidohydrolase family protein [Clostridiales bacterium]MCF8023534.1 amidohydrolase family protein [Clostridiales bacterium]